VRLLDQHPWMKEDKLFQRDRCWNLKRQRVPRQEIYRFPCVSQAENECVSNLGISLFRLNTGLNNTA